MKLNSKLIKESIVDYIKNNKGCIKELFSPEDQDSIDEIELQQVKIWKRTLKEKGTDGIYRYFAALGSKQVEINEQVTAEVITDFKDEVITSILIEG